MKNEIEEVTVLDKVDPKKYSEPTDSDHIVSRAGGDDYGVDSSIITKPLPDQRNQTGDDDCWRHSRQHETQHVSHCDWEICEIIDF